MLLSSLDKSGVSIHFLPDSSRLAVGSFMLATRIRQTQRINTQSVRRLHSMWLRVYIQDPFRQSDLGYRGGWRKSCWQPPSCGLLTCL